LIDDPEAAVDDAAARFERMNPDLADIDAPDLSMAGPIFQCNSALAMQLAVAELGVDLHAFGAEFLEQMARTRRACTSARRRSRLTSILRSAAVAASQRTPHTQASSTAVAGDETSPRPSYARSSHSAW